MWIALAFATVLALAVGFAVTTVLEVSDTLPGDILTTLTREEPPKTLGEIIRVDGPPTGVALGGQWVLIALLFGGVPAALLSAALLGVGRKSTSRTPWSGAWSSVFLGGLVFQMSSLALTALLLVWLLSIAWEVRTTAEHLRELQFHGLFLIVSLLSSTCGLRFWRKLQIAAHDAPVTIAPVQRPSYRQN